MILTTLPVAKAATGIHACSSNFQPSSHCGASTGCFPLPRLSLCDSFSAIFRFELWFPQKNWKNIDFPANPFCLALSTKKVSFNELLVITRGDLKHSIEGPSLEHYTFPTFYFSKHSLTWLPWRHNAGFDSAHRKNICSHKQQKKKVKGGIWGRHVSLLLPLLCSPAGRAVHGGITSLFDWEKR